MQLSDRYQGAWLRYGVMITPGLGMAYPETKEIVGKIFRDRIARLPWVPADWLAGVEALQEAYPDDLIRIAPSRTANVHNGVFVNDMGPPSRDNPLFLDTDAKIDGWMSIYRDMNAGIVAYAAHQAAVGRGQLNALYAKAAAWNALYKIAVFTAELPSNIATGFGGLLKDFILGDLRKNYGRTIGLVLLLGILVLFLVKPDLAKRWFGGLFAWFGRVLKGAAKGGTSKAARKTPPPKIAPEAA